MHVVDASTKASIEVLICACDVNCIYGASFGGIFGGSVWVRYC